jgi:hypothetical protein
MIEKPQMVYGASECSFSAVTIPQAETAYHPSRLPQLLAALLLTPLLFVVSDRAMHLPAYCLLDFLTNGTRLLNAGELASTAVFSFGAAAEAGRWLQSNDRCTRWTLWLYGLIAGLLTAIAGGGIVRDVIFSW